MALLPFRRDSVEVVNRLIVNAYVTAIIIIANNKIPKKAIMPFRRDSVGQQYLK